MCRFSQSLAILTCTSTGLYCFDGEYRPLWSQHNGLTYFVCQAITTVIVHLFFIYRLFRCTCSLRQPVRKN